MLEPLEEREMVTRKRFGAPWMKRTLAISALLLVAATPDDSPVADAAQRGEAGEIRNLLRQGADPSAAQPDGMTALHWSSLNNQPDIVETLIFAGATLQPPLAWAATRPSTWPAAAVTPGWWWLFWRPGPIPISSPEPAPLPCISPPRPMRPAW